MKIKKFINFMKETAGYKETKSTILCPTCDASGYLKSKDGKSKTCSDCKGTGQRKFKKDDTSKKI